MNFRNKYLVNTIRIILGLFLIFSGVGGFMSASNNMEGVPPEMMPNTLALWNMGLFQMIKVTEILVGLMLVVGFLPWLAAIVIAPLAIGIIVVNAVTSPQYLLAGAVVFVLNAFLGYAYWEKFAPLFNREWKA